MPMVTLLPPSACYAHVMRVSAGLDPIQEQQTYKGLTPGMLQALSQLGE